MKVLQLTKFYPPVHGGIESVTRELTEGLNRAGWPTDVLCADLGPKSRFEPHAAGYSVMRAASLGRLLSASVSPMLAWHLRQQIDRYDLVHVHMPDPMAALALWASPLKVPLVVHWHSDVIRQRLSRRLYEPLQTWLLRRAGAVIATSQVYADASEPLRRFRHKLRIVPIGISDPRGRVRPDRVAEIRRRFGGRRLVFALGRLTYYKGFDLLIEAAAGLPDDVAVMIGGQGELAATLQERIAARGLLGRVALLGQVDDADLASHFDACDVFCLPSTERSEAYGVAMVEAMAMGKPVVSTDITGSGVAWVNPDGVTGLGVPVGDVAALAAALRRLLDDERRRATLGAAARRRFETELSAQVMVDRTIAVYQRLLGVG